MSITGNLAFDDPPVRILNSDGSLFGVLHVSQSGESLFLSLPDGSEQEVGECGDELKGNSSAPNQHALRVLILQRNCGATVDVASHVVLEEAGRRLTVAIFEGRPKIIVQWRDAKTLEVQHSRMPAIHVYRHLPEALGVAVHFVPDLDGVGKSRYLDFANYNYGATGRAAGMPREYLLRVAGWSQQASGLYRREWGNWAGSAPYGDDPRGRVQILGGINYYEATYGSDR